MWCAHRAARRSALRDPVDVADGRRVRGEHLANVHREHAACAQQGGSAQAMERCEERLAVPGRRVLRALAGRRGHTYRGPERRGARKLRPAGNGGNALVHRGPTRPRDSSGAAPLARSVRPARSSYCMWRHRSEAPRTLPPRAGNARSRTERVPDESAHRGKRVGGSDSDARAADEGSAEGRPRDAGREAEDVPPQHGPQRCGAGGQRTDGAGGLEDVVGGRGGCDLHVQGGQAVVSRAQPTWCAHCQIGEHARGGVIAVCACPLERVRVARNIGSSSEPRAEGCSRGTWKALESCASSVSGLTRG